MMALQDWLLCSWTTGSDDNSNRGDHEKLKSKSD